MSLKYFKYLLSLSTYSKEFSQSIKKKSQVEFLKAQKEQN